MCYQSNSFCRMWNLRAFFRTTRASGGDAISIFAGSAAAARTWFSPSTHKKHVVAQRRVCPSTLRVGSKIHAKALSWPSRVAICSPFSEHGPGSRLALFCRLAPFLCDIFVRPRGCVCWALIKCVDSCASEEASCGDSGSLIWCDKKCRKLFITELLRTWSFRLPNRAFSFLDICQLKHSRGSALSLENSRTPKWTHRSSGFLFLYCPCIVDIIEKS